MAAHPGDDALIALVLGRLDATRADDVAAHLVTCRTCREAFDGYAESIVALQSASPRTGGSRAEERGWLGGARRFGGPLLVRSRTGRRWLRGLRVAAVLVVGLVLGAGAVLGWPQGEASSTPSPTAAWHAPLLTADGEAVGTIARSASAGRPVLVLEVTGGSTGEELTCRLVRPDESTADVAHLRLSDRRPNSWVIDTGGERPSQVQLVDQDGEVWAAARPPTG